jgi:hypothetical protein
LPRGEISPVAHSGLCQHYTHNTIDDNSNNTNEHYIDKKSVHTLNPTPTLARQTISTIALKEEEEEDRQASTTSEQNACRKHDRPAHCSRIVNNEEIVAGTGEEVQMSVL